MKTNAPYQALDLANLAAYMSVVALSDEDGMTAEARMELIDAVADTISLMVTSNAEHWKRVAEARA